MDRILVFMNNIAHNVLADQQGEQRGRYTTGAVLHGLCGGWQERNGEADLLKIDKMKMKEVLTRQMEEREAAERKGPAWHAGWYLEEREQEKREDEAEMRDRRNDLYHEFEKQLKYKSSKREATLSKMDTVERAFNKGLLIEIVDNTVYW